MILAFLCSNLKKHVVILQAPYLHNVTRICRGTNTRLDENIMKFVGRLIQVFTGDSMCNPYDSEFSS